MVYLEALAVGSGNGRVHSQELGVGEGAKHVGKHPALVAVGGLVPGHTVGRGSREHWLGEDRDDGRHVGVLGKSVDAVEVARPEALAVAVEGRVPRKKLGLGDARVVQQDGVAAVGGSRLVVLAAVGRRRAVERCWVKAGVDLNLRRRCWDHQWRERSCAARLCPVGWVREFDLEAFLQLDADTHPVVDVQARTVLAHGGIPSEAA